MDIMLIQTTERDELHSEWTIYIRLIPELPWEIEGRYDNKPEVQTRYDQLRNTISIILERYEL